MAAKRDVRMLGCGSAACTGYVFNGEPVTLVDLPGTYSLTAYSQEELVARRELAANNVQAVIDVVDSSALERNLLLTVQMLEMGMPVVLACNMMDEARAAGIHIDMDRLSRMLGRFGVTFLALIVSIF